MKILGIYDWHNCGAALVDDMEIKAAVEEERLSRRKVEFGLPTRSMETVARISETDPSEIDAIAVCGIYDPTPVVRWRQNTFRFERKINTRWWIQYRLWKLYYALRSQALLRSGEKRLNELILKRQLRRFPAWADKPVHHVDHHLCHASLGYRTSGFDEALILTIDGSGDGFSTALFEGRGDEIRFVAGARETASLGKMYANATLGLGFQKLTGEGKLMGLAAHGDPQPYYPHVERVLRVKDPDSLELENHADLLGNGWALQVRRDLARFRREDIAAAVQQRFEEITLALVRSAVRRLEIANVVLVGGAAMNVKLNQRVRESKEVAATYVTPAMTDAGVAAGAALEICHRRLGEAGRSTPRRPLVHTYLGPSYGNDEIRSMLERRGYADDARFVEDVDLRIGELVAEGHIVARFTGRLEHGPRALGNRSILALVTLDDVEERLNRRLGRDEFMPFAPSILEEYAAEYLEGYVYSPFMVETFDVKPAFVETFPAVVHVDGTLRPQIVRRDVAPGYWKLIQTVGEKTGYYLVLNTSFNLHGDPIICSPEEALDAFEHGAVDYLALGNWLLELQPGHVTRKLGKVDA